MAEMFLDSSYAIALSAPSDQLHHRAVELARRVQADTIRMITTRAVTLEIGNALAKQRYRQAAIALLTAVHNDANIEVIPLSEELWQRGFELYQQRPDKEWGMTDCVSFVVMQDRGIRDALTADAHFIQAGFQALLLQQD